MSRYSSNKHSVSLNEHSQFLNLFFLSLPLGLSTESKLFVLQRASHAKKWKGLITESGTCIFTGLTIVVALEDSDGEKRWLV